MLYLLLFLCSLPYNLSYPYSNVGNVSQIENTTHNFNLTHRICKNINSVCNMTKTNLCTMRRVGDEYEYKNFANWCELFVHNFCDYPETEFAIVEDRISCESYLSRRQLIDDTTLDTTTGTETSTFLDTTVMDGNGSTKPALREFSFLYDVEQAFDGHICPLSCPNTYAPTCINSNKGVGMYFKFFTFVNHCMGDLYYCKNWEEFMLPPEANMDERIVASGLSWSFCGAYRYLQFTRFAEVSSSMGYYGWLHGDQRHMKILEPHERQPGYG